MAYINAQTSMPASTKTFLNGRSTAVRIPAEFGIKPGEELLISQDKDGTLRLSRARPFASYFAALERMKAEERNPATEPFEMPRSGLPRPLDLAEAAKRYRARKRGSSR
jgi:virulence-associated protein VagC